MGTCKYCGASALTVSNLIGFCAHCVREHFPEVWPEIKAIHDQSRREYGFPENPPRDKDGTVCPLCFQRCSVAEGNIGYCGLRRVTDGKLTGGRPHEGNVSYYYDSLPTNCVADFVCPGGQGCSLPQYAVSRTPEYGYKNLAVYYQACSFNCLFCQNYHYKEHTRSVQKTRAEELAAAVDETTTCICYFGGDPGPQILHALRASRLARERARGRVLRICWETNGAMVLSFLKRATALSLDSGGCVKFDLKAWNDGIHRALCGVSTQHTLSSFRWVADWIPRRPEPPLLIASTLLVPGYVDEEEVSGIAGFLAGLNRDIPYRLLAFYPQFYLTDLPTTSRKHALRCKEVAEQAGLRRVSLGTLHLLGRDYG